MKNIISFLDENPVIFYYIRREIIPTIPWFYSIQKSTAYLNLKEVMFCNEYEEIIYELKGLLRYRMIDKIEIEVGRFCYDEWFDEFHILPENKIVWVFVD